MPPERDRVAAAGEHARAARHMQDTHQLPCRRHNSSLPPASHLAITPASPEQHAEGKDIACLAHHAVDQELRGHVSYCARCLCTQLACNVQLTAEPKVCNLQASAACVSSARVLLAGPAPDTLEYSAQHRLHFLRGPGRQLLLGHRDKSNPMPSSQTLSAIQLKLLLQHWALNQGHRHTASAVQSWRNRSTLSGRRTAGNEDPTHAVSARLRAAQPEKEAAHSTKSSIGASGLLQ